jgi:molecular chaperone DnaK (HSP70)
MVGGSTQIPKVKELIKSYFNGMEPKRAKNPEETNVYGAAIWANAL